MLYNEVPNRGCVTRIKMLYNDGVGGCDDDSGAGAGDDGRQSKVEEGIKTKRDNEYELLL